MAEKRNMQNVKFSSVDEFLEYLPEEEYVIVEKLRRIILNAIPACEERLSYNVPYYRRHYNICFIWPGSVQWGGKGNDGVRLGFTSGNLLSDKSGYLEKGNRKQVYWRDFRSASEVDSALLSMYLYEAVQVDEERARG